MKTERLILNQLIHNDGFSSEVLPFIKPEYFHDPAERTFTDVFMEFVNKYRKTPSEQALKIEIEKLSLPQDDFNETINLCTELFQDNFDPLVDFDWLRNTSEEFCKQMAIHNAFMDGIKIIEGHDKKRKPEILPDLMRDALAVSFDTSVGHDYFEDFESRFEYYHTKENRVPFRLDFLNKITRQGVPKKTLNMLIGGTNVGKTLAMCSLATDNLRDGQNVLYITAEMSEEEIGMRIDANMLDVAMDDIEHMPEDLYARKMRDVMGKTGGKLIIRQYPTAQAGVGHFRNLIHELEIKKGFKPDIVYIDYLNLLASVRIKSYTSSYEYYKSIAEELRGLAVELDVVIWTATQLNRGGFKKGDPDMDDTSDSFGLPYTVDLMLALISDEQLEELGQYMIKQLKNRYARKSKIRRFVIGVDYEKQRLYNVDESAQVDVFEGPVDRGSVMDKTKFGERFEDEKKRKGVDFVF